MTSLPNQGRVSFAHRSLRHGGQVSADSPPAGRAGQALGPVGLRDRDALFCQGMGWLKNSHLWPFLSKQTCLPTGRKVTGAAKRIKSRIGEKLIQNARYITQLRQQTRFLQ